MKAKFLSFFVALIATTALWASNTITYTATEMLTSSSLGIGSTTFGATITSHTFNNGTGTITCSGEITTIGDAAFDGCTGLTSITIPSSVTEIGGKAFYNCTGLTSVTIPSSVTTIGPAAFTYCNGLTSIDVDMTNTHYASINGVLFNYAKDTLMQYAIGNPRTEYIIPNSVTTIVSASFYYCSNLTSVTIPSSVTSIGDYAFSGCSGLDSVTIGNSVTTIGYAAFSDCSGLTSITIPNSVTTIGDYAFYHCSSLTSVTIPNSVTTIGYAAFYSCSGLTSVTIPSSVTTIGRYAFDGCSNLTSITWNAKNCRYPSSSLYAPFYNIASQINSFTFGEQVETIPSYLCSGMSQLTSITIPSSVTSIGSSAFSNCSNLTKTNYTGTAADWCKIRFSASTSNPIYYSRNFYINDVEVKDLVIPNGVDTISNYAFYYCTGLTSITIPSSVTTIGEAAFYECSDIKTVTWDAKNCNGYNFGNQVETFVFGGSVEVIPASICSGMTKLTSVTIPNSVTTIGNYAFFSCSGLTSVTIPNSVTTIGVGAFYGCSDLTSPVYNNTIFAFMPSSYKGRYTIPDGIKQITGGAFCECSALTSVTIPNSITTIGAYAFQYCSGLTSVTIPNSITTIGADAFQYCSGLKSVTWNAKNYGNPSSSSYAPFYNIASQINSFTFGEQVETIPSYLCSGMSQLTSITIPSSVTSIGEAAFAYCNNLFEIYCKAITPPSCAEYCFLDVSKAIPLYVPQNSMKAYQTADEWKTFTNIHDNEEDVGDDEPYTGPCNEYGWKNKGEMFLALQEDCNVAIEAASKSAIEVVREKNDSIFYLVNDAWVYWAYVEETNTPVGNNGDFASYSYGKGVEIVSVLQTNKWSWLLDYIKANYKEGREDHADMDVTYQILIRCNVQAFFFNSPTFRGGDSNPWSFDYTKAGKPTNFYPTWGYQFCEGEDIGGNEPHTGPCNEYGWADAEDMYQALAADILAYHNEPANNSVFGFASDFPTRGTFGEPDVNGNTGVALDIYPFDLNFWTTEPYASKWGWLATYLDYVNVANGKEAATSGNAQMRYTLAAFFANSIRDSWPRSADYTYCGVAHPETWQPYWGKTFCDDPTLPLHLTLSRDTIEKCQVVQLTVSIDEALFADLPITLASSNNLLQFSEAVIKAGETSCNVEINAIDDNTSSLAIKTSVVATAADYAADSSRLVIAEDFPNVTFSLSSHEHQETDGPTCMTATFTRTNKINRPITIVLKDNSSKEVIYSRTSFTMAAGVETATLQLGVEDNGFVDGDRDVGITAAIKLDGKLYHPKTQIIHIIDNDVPTLTITATTNTLVEGKSPAGKLTISRNTSTAEALSIIINSNNDENLTYEHQVQIPVGKTSVVVPIAVASDDVENNSHEVKFTISAEGFVGTEYYAIVADNTFADAYIESFSVDKNVVTVGDEVTFDVAIGNKGIIPLSKGIRLDLYSSNNDTHVKYLLTEPLLPNDTRHFTFVVTMPNVVGKYHYYVTINEDEVVRELFFDNNESDHVAVDVKAPYQVTSVTVDKSQCQMVDSVLISGAVEGEKISNMPVEIYVINEGYRSAITVSTDEQGHFSWHYAPAIGQSGRMNIGACYPQTNSKQTMATVDYYSLNVQTRYLQCMLTKGETLQQQIELYNPCGVALHNVHVVLPATSEIQGDLQSVSITSLPITELEGRKHATLALQLKSDILSSEKSYTIIPLRIISDEGTTNEIPLYVYCRNKQGELVLSVDKIETTMSAQSPHDYLLYFYNVGAGETGDISLSLPDWMTTVGATTIPSIPAGETTNVMLRMTSTADMQLNVARTGQIGINPTNCEGIALPYEVMLVSTNKGTLHVDVCDEYTYYTEQAPHVQAAQVLVKNPSTGAVVYQGLTNENGIYETELPEGYYTLSVSADNHDAYQATIFVEPNKVNSNIINLSVRAIELSWKVEETEVEDKYEIITTIKYETNVPAPVVVVKAPSSIEADKLNDGESLIYTVTITNQGLIRAEDVTISLPDGGSDFTFEALAYGTPFNLDAKQTVTMPVRVTRVPHASGMAPRKIHQIVECNDNMITLYYWDCGTDRKWHQYGVPLTYANCDGIPTREPCQGDNCGGTPTNPWRPTGHGGGGGPIWKPNGDGGYKHKDEDEPKYEPDADEGCEPCQNQFLITLVKCIPNPIGEALGDAEHILNCYNGGRAILIGNVNLGDLANCVIGFIPGLSDAKDAYECLRDLIKPCEHTAENAAAPLRRARLENKEQQKVDEPQYITDFRNKAAIAIAEIDNFQSFLNTLLPYDMVENVTMAEKADLLSAFVVYENTLATKEDLLPFRPSAMTDAVFDMFVERVQNTYRITHGEEVASANYIDSEEVITIWNSIIELENRAQEKGYESTSQLLMQSYELFQKQLEQASTSVCASITLQFNQKMVMTRQAFKGTLTVFNGHETEAMKNAHLNLTIYDEQGHLATDHEFEVHVETLNGFSGELSFDSEQGWLLPANTTGVATIMFIPTRYAAQTQPQDYSFGGTFSYVDPFTGLVVTRDLFPVTMTVKPTPILDMTYFVQRDVISDDPLTEDTIEPTEPAEFALLINNVGYGDAANVQMVTNAPKIVDNKKGLLIDFALLEARLNGKESYLPIDSCVATEFGTIPAQSQAYAQWYFTGSLLGHFTEYSIAATHLTSYDNPDLSLLNQVTVHEMIHTIQVPAEINASTVGWLVNDEVDIQDMPDKLYTSSAEILPLHIATDVKLTSVDAQTYRLTATPSETGWNYGTAMDPSNGKQQLISVIRESDNQEISLQNVWVTSVTLQDGLDPVHEYRIHIADLLTGETSYLLSFTEQHTISISFVNYDGTLLSETKVPIGEIPVYAGTTPTKNLHDGYTYSFLDWAPSLTAAMQDTTYTATFSSTANAYYVCYHAEDATSGAMANSQHTYGTPSHLSKNTFVREGYQFLGWTTGATNEVEYADEAEILNLTTTPNAIVHLYAVWRLSSITLYDRPTGEQTWQQAAEHLQAQLTDLKNKCDANSALTCDVRIVRTIAHNGVLTPICLPFSLSADEISNASSPLHQAYIYSFDCRVQKNSNEVEVRMRRQNHIIAGVPYVIKFTHGDDQDYFDFKDVRITVDEPLTDESTAMNFVGNFLPIPLESSENILYVTTDGSLCWWDSSIDDGVTYLRGFRAHFVINTPALKSIRRGMKVVMVEQEDTDTPTDLDWVKNAENAENNDNAHPQKVIINGQLYIISNGKTYNALGAMVD